MCGILVHALVFLLLLRLSVNFTSIYEGNSLTKQEKKQARKFARDIYKDQDEKTMDSLKVINKEIERQQDK